MLKYIAYTNTFLFIDGGFMAKKKYTEMTKEELLELKDVLKAAYKKMQARGLELNMSRGKPCVDQLDGFSKQLLRPSLRRRN